jgi:hypothetical protein
LVPVIRRPEYTVSLEQISPDTPIVHCVVNVPWTGSVCKKLRSDVDTFMSLHGGPLHTGISPSNTKLQRFARLMGARHTATYTEITSGRTLLIFTRDS